MRSIKSKPLSVLPFLYLTAVVVSSLETPDNRQTKHFSLFSVVQFDNEECTTDTTPAGGTTQGTCYTSTECTDKGGVKAGRCAAGFGVCCAFINIAAANANIMENRTRLRNAEFPLTATAVAAQNIAYTINKMQSDICQLRLDFTRFVIAGPANTAENIGAAAAQTTNTHCLGDTLTITTTDAANAADSPFGTLCGALTGEHLYVELTPTAADTAVVTITTNNAADLQTPAAAVRAWDIKVSQIECFATYRAPAGCNRFILADAGQITSFNFLQLATGGSNLGTELASQRVKTCIRRSKGMCCVEYQVCTAFGGIALADTAQTHTTPATINQGVGSGNAALTQQFINAGWSIDTNTNPYMIDTAAMIAVNGNMRQFNSQMNIGMVDAQCSGDYVEIPSSWSGGCGSSHGSSRNTINSRYCGARFGANFQSASAATSHTPVCDCSEPFVVRHNSDSVNDIGGTAAIAVNAAKLGTARPRGFCLDFRQLPCWN